MYSYTSFGTSFCIFSRILKGSKDTYFDRILLSKYSYMTYYIYVILYLSIFTLLVIGTIYILHVLYSHITPMNFLCMYL